MAQKEVAEEHITIRRRIITDSDHFEKKQLPITPELIKTIETKPVFEDLDEFQDEVKRSAKKKAAKVKAKTQRKTKKKTSRHVKKAKETLTKTEIKTVKKRKKRTKIPTFKELRSSLDQADVLGHIDKDKLDEASSFAVQMLEDIKTITRTEKPDEEDQLANDKFTRLSGRFDTVIENNKKNIEAIDKLKAQIKEKPEEARDKTPTKEPPPQFMPLPKINIQVDRPPPVAPKKSFMQKLVEFIEHMLGKSKV